MIPEHHQRYYAFVWPLFWPWLWLQLWRLERWQRQTGRGVLLAVDRRGNVFIRAVAEAPGKWRYEAPAMPVWQRPALGSDLPSEFLEAFAPAPDAGEAPHPRAAHAASAPLYLNFDTS